MANSNQSKLHIAMFPWFAMGHMIPFLRFSNELAAKGHQVSFIVPTKTQSKLQQHNLFPHLISFVPLNVPHVEGLPTGSETMSDVPYSKASLLVVAMDLLEPQLQLLFPYLNPHFIFYDFAFYVPKIACKLGAKSVFFAVVSPLATAFLLPNHVIEKGSFTEDELLLPPPNYPSSHSFKLPKFKHGSLSHLFHKFGLNNFTFAERFSIAIKECDAIAYRTCREIEGPFFYYIGRLYNKPVLLTGPLLIDHYSSSTTSDNEVLEQRWAEWLAQFGKGSVVFCAFGSECRLERAQFQELVLGLELTGLPFLATLKAPIGAETVDEALPDGFKERLRERGVVHGGWVQQTLVLRHSSIGCFVSHCGYGSMWEGLVLSDAQMVLLPQIPDQFLNAQLLSRELRVGVEVERREEDGWFSRESVCKAVKLVMDGGSQVGEELRGNHTKWKSLLSSEGFESSYVDSFVKNLEGLITC